MEEIAKEIRKYLDINENENMLKLTEFSKNHAKRKIIAMRIYI